ncbi:MAG TPA: GatB/YqeY domain-containing protein [Anaerolineae bacterium]|nr:GatB/YqeY domain-containing protein [Anaerolineae bacterium]
MSLLEQLDIELKEAMLARDEDRKRTLRSVKTAAANALVEKRTTEGMAATLSDEEVLKVIAKQASQRRDSIEEFSKAGRMDLVAPEQAELAILERYLPKQMDAAEVKAVVEQVIAETGASSPKELGLVMRTAMARLHGQADGKLVNQYARELLS